MYNLAEWLDHVTDPSNCFTITDNGNGTVTIKKAGTVMTQGTPQDQAHFNNMEQGILEAHIVGALALLAVRQLGWRADVSEEANAAFESDTELNLQDVGHAISFILNHTRQVGWQVADLEKWAASYEVGEVELTSATAFPLTLFSRPSTTVALAQRRPNSDYVVLTDVVSSEGNVGEVVVYDKLNNGFKLSYTGSAPRVKIKYTVFGGPYT